MEKEAKEFATQIEGKLSVIARQCRAFGIHLILATQYSNIGINKIDSMQRMPNCPFVLYVGTKKLVKRKEFEQYISHRLVI